MIGGQIDYLDEEIELGWLFASKALLQIFVNPFSGLVTPFGQEIKVSPIVYLISFWPIAQRGNSQFGKAIYHWKALKFL
jgi:hypothetical protein